MFRRRIAGEALSGAGLFCCGVLLLGIPTEAAAQPVYAPGTVGPAPTPGPEGANPAAADNTGPAATRPVPQVPAWVVTPSLELGEVYNDNVNLAPKGSAVWDVITTITPALQITGRTARLTAGLVYDPQQLIFARGTSSNTLQQRLQGTGRAELLRETLFFDASASIDQQFLRNTGPIGPTTLTSSSNLTTVEAASGSPYLLQHLGGYADSETRYRFTRVSTSSNTVAPEHVHDARQVFTSGENFGRLGWVLTGEYIRLDRLSGTADPLGGTSGKDALGRLDLKYPIYGALSIIGGAGYERITDPTLIEQPHGAIWNAGLQYQPNPLFAASLTYGRRFNRSDTEFNGTYHVTPQLNIRAIYTQTIQTSQSQIASNLSQVSLGPNGTLVNTPTGLPFVASNASPGVPSSAFGITSGAFIEKRFQAIVEATRGRNTYFVSGYDVKQSGTVSTFVVPEKIQGGSIAWTRQLWPELTSSLGGSYYRASFQDGSGRVDNSYSVSLGLAYTISPTATAKISLSRFDTRSNIGANSLVNDLVMASIRKQF